MLIRRKSLKAWVATKGGKSLKAWVAQKGRGTKSAKNTIIESKGCQEGGWRGRKKKHGLARRISMEKYLIKRKSFKALKARVAKTGWGGKF